MFSETRLFLLLKPQCMDGVGLVPSGCLRLPADCGFALVKSHNVQYHPEWLVGMPCCPDVRLLAKVRIICCDGVIISCGFEKFPRFSVEHAILALFGMHNIRMSNARSQL